MVTAENFARAESNLYFTNVVKDGGFGKFHHNRELTPIERQTVIRMNRDTLYSAAVFDLDAGPVTITLPDAGKRFMSLQVIDEDHFTPAVYYGPGAHTLDRKAIGTRYVITALRTFVDPADPKDLAEVHKLQDATKVEQKARGKFEVTAWDQASQKKTRDALLTLGSTLPDSRRMFGARGQVDPVRHLIGSALAWGGNPEEDAIYLNVTPTQNDGKTAYRLTVKDVPVDGFWSISVYNAKGYFEPNALNSYTLNNVTAKKGADGSITVAFGGDASAPNFLPVTPGWNYMVRLYRPRSVLLDGTWKFPEAQVSKSPEAARRTAKDAYIYAYAMFENYATIYKQAVDTKAPEYIGGFNTYKHYSEPFTAKNHDIVTPNNDTPYSWAWLDLRSEPYVLSVPEVPEGRYYVVQWIDLFTHNFAYVGSRSTGNGAGNYLIAGPLWNGEVPDGIKSVLRSETQLAGTLTRTALDGPEDVANVKAIQAGLKLNPLSRFLGKPAPEPAPTITFPPPDKAKEESQDFIEPLNFLLQFYPVIHPTEVDLFRRFAEIGIGAGKSFEPSKVEAETLAAIDAGVKDAREQMAEVSKRTLSSNGLFGSREFLKNDYMRRDIGAEKGLYGNSIEEAWYGGYLGDGKAINRIHFAKDQLPPAKFFWSMTLYTLPERFLYDNPLDRYSIGNRTKGLRYDADGGLTIYLGHESPGKELESNWLPAPSATFSLVARVYGPSEVAMKGEWKLPPLQPAR
jgi:hypothetical protein